MDHSWMKVTFRLLVTCTLFSSVAIGQEAVPSPEVGASVSGGVADLGLNRPYLFFTDPSLPASGHVILGVGLGTVTQSGEGRPVGAGPLLPTFSAEVGLLSRLSIYAKGEAAFNASGQTADSNIGIEAGAHILLTDPRSRDFHVALEAAVGSDFSGQFKVQVNAVAGWDIKQLRLTASLTGAHDFAEDADALDVSGVLAASYLLPFELRLGAEAIAQDLEELLAAAAEGGATVYAGPTLGWEFRRRLQIVIGPMFGLTTGASQVLARGAASILF